MDDLHLFIRHGNLVWVSFLVVAMATGGIVARSKAPLRGALVGLIVAAGLVLLTGEVALHFAGDLDRDVHRHLSKPEFSSTQRQDLDAVLESRKAWAATLAAATPWQRTEALDTLGLRIELDAHHDARSIEARKSLTLLTGDCPGAVRLLRRYYLIDEAIELADSCGDQARAEAAEALYAIGEFSAAAERALGAFDTEAVLPTLLVVRLHLLAGNPKKAADAAQVVLRSLQAQVEGPRRSRRRDDPLVSAQMAVLPCLIDALEAQAGDGAAKKRLLETSAQAVPPSCSLLAADFEHGAARMERLSGIATEMARLRQIEPGSPHLTDSLLLELLAMEAGERSTPAALHFLHDLNDFGRELLKSGGVGIETPWLGFQQALLEVVDGEPIHHSLLRFRIAMEAMRLGADEQSEAWLARGPWSDARAEALADQYWERMPHPDLLRAALAIRHNRDDRAREFLMPLTDIDTRDARRLRETLAFVEGEIISDPDAVFNVGFSGGAALMASGDDFPDLLIDNLAANSFYAAALLTRRFNPDNDRLRAWAHYGGIFNPSPDRHTRAGRAAIQIGDRLLIAHALGDQELIARLSASRDKYLEAFSRRDMAVPLAVIERF